jgi:hypothetical protein
MGLLSYLVVLSNILLVAHAHSMMTCAVLGADGTSCVGPIRDSTNSINSAAYRWNQDPSGAICQPNARGVSNLAKYYPNGMGALSAGSTFKVQWPARNHAVNNQNPRVVKVYMSPVIASGQTADFTSSVMMQNKLCEGPFINCGKGAGVDTTGDSVPCTLSCTIPANTPQGTYTLWWQWDWTVNDGAIYATCADVTVSSSIVAPPPNNLPATSVRTSNAVRTSAAARTSAAKAPNNAQTSAEAEQDTAVQPQETNVDAAECGGPDTCVAACGGAELVRQCTCENGQFLVHCTSSSYMMVPLLAVILSAVMFLL